MKGKRTWLILLVLWVILVLFQVLAYVGVLRFGKVPGWCFVIGVMGILNCIWHLKNGD